MAFSLTQFANSPGPDQLSALDNNFTTLSAADTIACAISGTNTLTFTQNAAGVVPSQTISAYTNYMLFVGVATGTNTGPVTATVGTVGALNVYKDGPAGPVFLSGQEIVTNNAISLRYDSSLNSGAGGFHLTSSTQIAGVAISPSAVQINGNSTLTNLLSGSVSITFTAAPGWGSQDQPFSITAALASALPAVGDFVLVNPPSVAGPGISYAGYVSTVASLSSVASVATINIRQINSASASLASNSGVYRYAAMRTVP
jgi:hypothetical protein